MVVFYFAVAYALHLNVSLFDLAVIVPLSFVVQMLPGVGERLRRPRGDVLVLLHAHRPADRIGAAAVARRAGADHAVLAHRRGRLRRARSQTPAS